MLGISNDLVIVRPGVEKTTNKISRWVRTSFGIPLHECVNTDIDRVNNI